jgi:predicted GIY-YIG superfamily endonuclease
MQDKFAGVLKERRRLWFSFDDFNMLPEWPCCYVFYLHGKIVYIGQTENLLQRFRSHEAKSPWFSSVGLTLKFKLSRRFGDWAMTEVRLIKRLKPEWNRRGVASKPHSIYS